MSLHSIRDPSEPESMNPDFFSEIESLDDEIYKDVSDKIESYVYQSEDKMFVFDIEEKHITFYEYPPTSVKNL